jgi:hypothetical protein
LCGFILLIYSMVLLFIVLIYTDRRAETDMPTTEDKSDYKRRPADAGLRLVYHFPRDVSVALVSTAPIAEEYHEQQEEEEEAAVIVKQLAVAENNDQQQEEEEQGAAVHISKHSVEDTHG